MKVKVDLVERLRTDYPVQLLCKTLSLGVSTYYRHQDATSSPDPDSVRALIVQIFREHRGRYGSPRITAELRARGLEVNHKRVERIMFQEGLRARSKPRRKQTTTDSEHEDPIAPNLVQRRFQAEELNRLWFTDTTCVATREHWLYLTCVMDACSKRIVGWSMSTYNDRHMVCRALSMALHDRKPEPGLVIHSDRGSTFASADVRHLLESYEVQRSMSRKGNCYDNAVQESFFASFKRETRAGRGVYDSHDSARREIFEYINLYYNTKRRHSQLDYLTPNEHEMLIKQA